MGNITAGLVKELRERTGSGMMECKKALVETDGDIESAVELMRKTGLAKADKKSGRIAAEGIIVLRLTADDKRGCIVEVNCETDFVAKGDDFTGFVSQVAEKILDAQPADLDTLLELPLSEGGESVNVVRQGLIAKIGENISIRRFSLLTASDGVVGGYLHGSRIGVLVELKGGSAELAKDIAMHIAASNPIAINADDVSAEELAREKDIFSTQAAESGKSPEIIEKMVEGRIRKFFAEVTLVGQPFVKDPDTTVGKLLEDASASVVHFERLEVGEGIEKKEDNFAEEVMAQVQRG